MRRVPLVSTRRPQGTELAAWLERQRATAPSFEGPLPDSAPPGFDLDVERVPLGAGGVVFAAAREALRRWAHCELGWLEAAPRAAPPAPGLVFAMLARVAGLWFANACRVRRVVDEERAAGYEHVTLADHAERGAESFLVRWAADDAVSFEIRGVSRPARWWVAAGRPVARAAQARFRRDAAAALQRAVRAALDARAV